MAQTIPDTMQAAAIDRFGGIGEIEVQTVRVPEVGPDEVLIRSRRFVRRYCAATKDLLDQRIGGVLH